jgi:uncharacterized membrane protein YphA (DoxX/SURF4 family)
VKMKTIAYWTATLIFAAALLADGVAQLAAPGVIDAIMQMGYPHYFVTILGIWNVLGAIALLVPRFPRLKEWAYAGFFFEMTGAAASHVAHHDSASRVAVTLTLAALAAASWALRPSSRTLAVPVSAERLERSDR